MMSPSAGRCCHTRWTIWQRTTLSTGFSSRSATYHPQSDDRGCGGRQTDRARCQVRCRARCLFISNMVAFLAEHLLELVVGQDLTAVLGVLQVVGLDVLPHL